MELRQLAALVSVARNASFTKAAEQLYLTQSAVTRQIAALERETNCKLFDRLGRSVVVTSAGQALVQYAIDILRLESEAVAALADVRSGSGGALSVGCSSTAAAYLLPPVLQRFREDRPGVDLSVRTGPSSRVAEMVAGNEVDVGLLMDEPAIAGLQTISIAHYAIALIVYAGHPLIQRAASVTKGLPLAELADLPLILMQSGASLRRSVDNLLGQTAPNPTISMELDNVEAIKKMIEARLGVSLLPDLSVKHEIAAGTLVALPIDAPRPPNPSIVLVYQEGKYIGGAMRAFMELAKEKLSDAIT